MRLADVMGASGLVSWAEAGLVVSVVVFAAIVIWVFVIRSKASYEDARHLPLEDDADPATDEEGKES